MVVAPHPDRRRPGRLLPLPQPVLPAHPAAGPAVQHLPAGPGLGDQAPRPGRHRARGRPRRPTPSTCPPSTGEIAFDHVSFGYDPDGRSSRTSTSRFARVRRWPSSGPTGAGKSTLAKLVTRFYDPTDGRVLIDGHDLRDVTMHSLRSQLGVVPQEPFLFAGTIGDNIAFARPDATDDEIHEAVDRVGPHRRDRADAQRPRHRRPRAGPVPVVGRAPAASPWPGPSWPIPGCWCSTRPPPTSTCSRRRRSRPPSTSCSRTAPPSSSPTGCRRPCGPTASWWSTTAGSSRSGTHDELVAPGGRYAEMYATWVRQSELEEHAPADTGV